MVAISASPKCFILVFYPRRENTSRPILQRAKRTRLWLFRYLFSYIKRITILVVWQPSEGTCGSESIGFALLQEYWFESRLSSGNRSKGRIWGFSFIKLWPNRKDCAWIANGEDSLFGQDSPSSRPFIHPSSMWTVSKGRSIVYYSPWSAQRREARVYGTV